MNSKGTIKSLLIVRLLLLVSIWPCMWGAQVRPPLVTPKYITAAILIDIKPKYLISLLNRAAEFWDTYHATKLGKSFVEKRTLMSHEGGYHLTLVNFEFDSEKLDEKQKKELMSDAEKALKNIVETLLPMAVNTYSFLHLDAAGDDGRRIVEPDPQSEPGVYHPSWTLKFDKFEIVTGKQRAQGHKPPLYLVATMKSDDTLIRLRNHIITLFQGKFPQAEIRKEFIPHVSIVRMSPVIRESDIGLPNQLPEFKINVGQFNVPIYLPFVKVNVEERGGGVKPAVKVSQAPTPQLKVQPAAAPKTEPERKSVSWAPYQTVMIYMRGGNASAAKEAILERTLNVRAKNPATGRTLYQEAKEIEKGLDKKITQSQDWKDLMNLLAQ